MFRYTQFFGPYTENKVRVLVPRLCSLDVPPTIWRARGNSFRAIRQARKRDNWFALRAYPEFPIWPMHLDSLFCIPRTTREFVRSFSRLRCGYITSSTPPGGWSPEGEQERASRVAEKNVAVIEYRELVEWIAQTRRLNAPMIFNREDWGLDGEPLRERTL